MRTFFKLLFSLPGLKFLPPGMRMPGYFMLGLLLGMTLLLLQISRATSYLSDSPETCMNCHLMSDAYLSWKHSSHAEVAVCNDCHVPHTSFPREYAFKAHDGLRHATIFTLEMEPQSIRLSEGAIPAVQENCVRCHEQRVAEVSACRYVQGDLRCWDCHREVPHGRVHSLSASPKTFIPKMPSPFEDTREDTIRELKLKLEKIQSAE